MFKNLLKDDNIITIRPRNKYLDTFRKFNLVVYNNSIRSYVFGKSILKLKATILQRQFLLNIT